MKLIRGVMLLSCLALVVGCNGDAGAKTALPATNAAAKPPTGVSGTVTNADGTTTEGASAGKTMDPVE